MACAPQLKIFDRHGVYQAACKEYEAAAALVSFYGAGARVNYAGCLAKVDALWIEGKDGVAGESYDSAANLMIARTQALEARWDSGLRGAGAIAPHTEGRS